jgi:hypothetical protein
MKNKSNPTYVCSCDGCRRGIRGLITSAFRRERRWMGEWVIRVCARLGWVPLAFYREVLADMLRLGLLIKLNNPEGQFPEYMLASLTVTSRPRKRGGQ